MRRVIIKESIGGVNPSTGLIFTYQKGDIVDFSDAMFKNIGANCEELTPEEKTNISKTKQAVKKAKQDRTEILGNIENRIDKTVKRKR